MFEELKKRKERFEALEKELSSDLVLSRPEEFRSKSKEYADLKDIVRLYDEYESLEKEKKSLEEIIKDGSSEGEFVFLAEKELETVKEKLASKVKELEDLIIDEGAGNRRAGSLRKKNIIMEIRAGTGGTEASLFAGELYKMYVRYAAAKGWKTAVMSLSESDLGGIKEVIFAVEGKDCYKFLRFEMGTHRVQRVPVTEAGGRIHTSAVTVAVLPEAEEVELEINPQDLKFDYYRSSGAGGQHVNTTDSAVRITHVPTGIVVSCQDERSQHKNKAKAMRVLCARILDELEEKHSREIADTRKKQVGSGDRSEKIRTYNFPENRVTDHRIKFSMHNLPAVLEGGLDELVAALLDADRRIRLKAV